MAGAACERLEEVYAGRLLRVMRRYAVARFNREAASMSTSAIGVVHKDTRNQVFTRRSNLSGQ